MNFWLFFVLLAASAALFLLLTGKTQVNTPKRKAVKKSSVKSQAKKRVKKK